MLNQNWQIIRLRCLRHVYLYKMQELSSEIIEDNLLVTGFSFYQKFWLRMVCVFAHYICLFLFSVFLDLSSRKEILLNLIGVKCLTKSRNFLFRIILRINLGFIVHYTDCILILSIKLYNEQMLLLSMYYFGIMLQKYLFLFILFTWLKEKLGWEK